jgi:hypothetical protein
MPPDWRATITGPNVQFGQTASPTSVPGTPDAARYGPIPTLTPFEVELSARIENLLHSDATQQVARNLISRPRSNYFPHELTEEALQLSGKQAEGFGGRRVSTQAGFRKAREENAWINRLINTVNEQEKRAAASAGRAPELLEQVPDTTAAMNRFWARLPEKVRQLMGPFAESQAERFSEDVFEVLRRRLHRGIEVANDYDLMANLRRRAGRKFARESPAGVVQEYRGVPEESRLPPGWGRERRRGASAAADEPMVLEDGRYRLPDEPPRLGPGEPDARVPGVSPPEPPAPEMPSASPGAFQGVSPGSPEGFYDILGYAYPKNASWRRAFPNQALPRELAGYVDALGEPYWANKGAQGLLEQFMIRPLHKLQLPWKVAATSGSGFRFALRNYMSQQIFNLQEYGPLAFAPSVQKWSHVMALGDDVISPSALEKTITLPNGSGYTVRELRDVAHQTGLWRTTVESELWSGPSADLGRAPHSTTTAWQQPQQRLSATLGKIGQGAQKTVRAIGPVNPFSKDFLPTKGVKLGKGGPRIGFQPLAEYGERQGRMAALLLELRRGKDLVQAAQDAAKVHVNYQAFSPAFEKYGTLAYPFAKFGVGMLPNELRWALTQPGRTMVSERVLRAGERMVPEEERERYRREPKSELIEKSGARLVGYPGVGALKEPETGRTRGEGRLPYVAVPPTADSLLNILGAPARIASARNKGRALASEVLEDAFPAFKAPYEIATGRNVFTGEPIDLLAPQPAPRAVQVFYRESPELARHVFRAAERRDPRTGDVQLVTPSWVNLLWRYYPNVAAADLAAGFLGGKRPYDNETAMALRALGITQLLHDPAIPASQQARESARLSRELRRRLMDWQPPSQEEAP